MIRICDRSEIDALIEKNRLDQYFDTPDLQFTACRYQKGEFLNRSDGDNHYLQFVVDGSVSVYFIHEDGSKYSLEYSEDMLLIGETAFVSPPPSPFHFCAEAVTEAVSVALPLNQYRSALQQDRKFLNFLAAVLLQKLSRMSDYESVSLPLEERVLNHMKYYCRDGVLCGIETTAFRLHCSNRHLQRVLNQLEAQKKIQKCAKGTYRLLQADATADSSHE